MATSVRLAAPSGFTLTLSLTLLTAVVLGGLGTLSGALIGAALLTFLPPVVTDLGVTASLDDIRAAELAPLLYGLVMVAVILLAPAGLVGSLRNLRHRRAAARAGVPPTPPAPGHRPEPTTPDVPDREAVATTSKGETR